jgi:hypothetical protein
VAAPGGRLVFLLVAMAVIATLFAGRVEASPAQVILYGTDGSGGNLLKHLEYGYPFTVGNMGQGRTFPALAYDRNNWILYTGEGWGEANVYTVDTITASTTLIGNAGLGQASIGAMDFSSAGVLYASVGIAGNSTTGSDHLATINTSTGEATLIGPFGECTGVTVPSQGEGLCDIEGMEAITFDSEGTLWGALSEWGPTGSPGLYTIDRLTGIATFVAPILDGSNVPSSGGIESLQFFCYDVLYGGTGRAKGSSTDGGFLVTIDPVTGVFEYAGNISATGGPSLGALTYEGPCYPGPDYSAGAPPGCLIGTVSAGTEMVGDVALLRRFRDEILLKSAIGQTLVKAYYRHSPAVANKIKDSEQAKRLVRCALKPFIWGAKIVLDE